MGRCAAAQRVCGWHAWKRVQNLLHSCTDGTHCCGLQWSSCQRKSRVLNSTLQSRWHNTVDTMHQYLANLYTRWRSIQLRLCDFPTCLLYPSAPTSCLHWRQTPRPLSLFQMQINESCTPLLQLVVMLSHRSGLFTVNTCTSVYTCNYKLTHSMYIWFVPPPLLYAGHTATHCPRLKPSKARFNLPENQIPALKSLRGAASWRGQQSGAPTPTKTSDAF